ncbi:MAG: hypothetical protein JRI25_12625 [Deltaproteobacteria bacterium]|nr:hypothetical protein [Deltaproteobacteria bacterium]
MSRRPSRCELEAGFRNAGNRGSYLVTITLVLSVLFGLSAFVIDVGYIKLAAIQAQNAADAGAHAALVEMKQGGTLSESRALAQEVMRLHRIAGLPVEVDPVQDILFGGWDFSRRAFDPTSTYVNAVQVRVRRTQGSPGGPVDLLIGIYNPQVEVASPVPTIAAFRSREILVAIDLDGWPEDDVAMAAEASLVMLDNLVGNGLPDDKIGMVRLASDPWKTRDGAAPQREALGMPLRVVQGDADDIRAQWAKRGDGTRDGVGIDTAIGLFEPSDDTHTEKVMVLVSDGFSTVEARSARARDMTALAASKSISIYPVSLNRTGSQTQRDFLASLTTGLGNFNETDEATELSVILRQIAQQVPISLVQ